MQGGWNVELVPDERVRGGLVMMSVAGGGCVNVFESGVFESWEGGGECWDSSVKAAARQARMSSSGE